MHHGARVESVVDALGRALGLVDGTVHMSTFGPYRIELGRKTPRYQVKEF